VSGPRLVLDAVSVVLGGRPVLDGLTLAVPAGQFVAIVGVSGAGKTTLLRAAAGLVPPAAGRVTLDGEPVLAPSRRMAMVFQHFGLFPWKTVRSNVEYGLRVWGAPRDGVPRLLAAMRLAEVADRYPAQLSGGMRQRVGIARALAVAPEVLLLDEPFSALDAITRERLQDEVLALWEGRAGMTALLVTHDLDEALVLADRVVVIAGPPGRVTLDVPVELPRPRDGRAVRAHPGFGALRDRLWRALGVPA
jgi:ABC-type nitrate/sulfonate/bicarbonate transport system ATPase subunit